MFTGVKRAAGQLQPLSSQWRRCKELARRIPRAPYDVKLLLGGRPSLLRVRFGLQEDIDAAPTTPAPADPHAYFMGLALLEGAKAAARGDVPVGAVLVSNAGEVLAAAHNQVEALGDPTAHAEMLCLRRGAAAVGGWRLLGTTMYVTLEPCPMCAGALLQARVGTLVYGARNLQLGADGSWIAMLPRGETRAGGGAGAQQESLQRQQQQQQGRRGQERQRQGQGQQQEQQKELDGAGTAAKAAEVAEQQGLQWRRGWHAGGSDAAASDGTGLGGCPDHSWEACKCGALGGWAGHEPNSSQEGYHSNNGGSDREGRGPVPEAAAGVPRHPYHPTLRVVRGVLEAECSELMRDFFRGRRRQQQEKEEDVGGGGGVHCSSNGSGGSGDGSSGKFTSS